MAANSCAGFNTIEVPAGDFELTLTGNEIDPPGPGADRFDDLDVLEPVRIVGAADGGTVLRSSASGLFQIVYASSALDTVLENLTLDGTGQTIRGVRVGFSQLKHPRVTIRSSHLHSFGAGAIEAAAGSQLRVLDSELTSNVAYDGGAISSQADQLEVSSCRFLGNRAQLGGALSMRGSPLAHIRKSTFEANHANFDSLGYGGAIFTFVPLQILDSSFIGNDALRRGGAIFTGASLSVERSTFEGNRGHDGGAIFNLSTDSLTLRGCTLSHNAATGDSNSDSFGGGAVTALGGHTRIYGSEFDFNEAFYGGALSLRDTLEVERASFVGNRAEVGGAIGTGWDASIANATFSGNSARDGAAVYVWSHTIQLKSSTVFGNLSEKGVLLAAGTGKIVLTHSIVSNDPTSPGTAQLCNAQNPTSIIQSIGHNFFQDDSCPLLPDLDTSSPDPKLRPLEYRPGSDSVKLASHHPEQDSLAADHGSFTASAMFGTDTCAKLDVWGRLRPADAVDIPWFPPRCDIGAVEVHPELP
jgi:hypothetical protein